MPFLELDRKISQQNSLDITGTGRTSPAVVTILLIDNGNAYAYSRIIVPVFIFRASPFGARRRIRRTAFEFIAPVGHFSSQHTFCILQYRLVDITGAYVIQVVSKSFPESYFISQDNVFGYPEFDTSAKRNRKLIQIVGFLPRIFGKPFAFRAEGF